MQILSDQLKREVKGKVSQFILSEAGRVGYRNAFSMAALVTASSLAAVMLSVHSAKADLVPCGDKICRTPPDGNDVYCCEIFRANGVEYVCEDSSPPDNANGDPWICWYL